MSTTNVRTTMTAAAAQPVGPTAPAGLPRLLPSSDPTPTYAAHLARYGALPYRGAKLVLVDAIDAAGITGRGGAAFPTGRKMRTVAAGRSPVVVANGAEGEPAAWKDKTLLAYAPHLVLDGLQLAAEAVGSREAYLYLHRDATLVRRIDAVLADRRARGIDRVDVTVVTAPLRFLSGEESALVSRVEGGAALPQSTPPRVYESGVRGRPTLVQNVETLAHVALVARYGPAWYRELGTTDEPGSMLLTVHRAERGPRVMEAARGTALVDVVGPLGASRALLVGGYHGAWIRSDVAAGLRLLDGDLRPHGAALGAGVLAVLPGDRCGVRESARVVTYLALESAGQCGPCLNGLPRIAAALERLAAPSPAPGVLADVQRWCGLVEGRGACHHPDGTTRFVRSALAVFGDEFALHASGRCSARDGRAFLPTDPAGPTDDWS